MSSDEPTVESRPAQPYAGIGATVTMQSIGSSLPPLVPELFEWLGSHDVEPAGPPFFKYDVIDMAGELQVEVGIPVAAPVTGDDRVSAATLPGGSYATVTHVGAPPELEGVTANLLAWADAKGLSFDVSRGDAGERWACRLELYETDPMIEPDPNTWVTTLAFRLAD